MNSPGDTALTSHASLRSTSPLPAAFAWTIDFGSLIPAAAGLLLLVAAALFLAWVKRRRLKRLFAGRKAAAAERRRTVRALRQTEVFYHSLVETIPQMILCKDLDGRFTFANQKFCAELGTTNESIKGKTDFDFFPKQLAEKYRRDDKAVIESGQVLDVVEEHVTPKGEKLYVQVMKTPLYGPDGKAIGIQGIFWDVTERLRAESRMVETEKLASLGQLVTGVAHEINNPLAFVSNNVAVLERDLRDMITLIRLYTRVERPSGAATNALHAEIDQVSEQLDLDYTLNNLPKLIERTRDGLRRIEQIVKDLRLFARVDEGDWNEVDLNPGIESSVNMVQGYARKKGIRLVTELEPLPPVRCRGARIHQVVVNLLMNGIDACGTEGTVTIHTRPDADGIRIEVTDNGCGIEPAIRERIFDPFFTTKRVGEGTGLGLSISYGIVQEHHGTIEVQSEPASGSCFSVRLPCQPHRALVRGSMATQGVG
jgi:PAS domain S-box-containing protein